jgi:hypothetical protein
MIDIHDEMCQIGYMICENIRFIGCCFETLPKRLSKNDILCGYLHAFPGFLLHE